MSDRLKNIRIVDLEQTGGDPNGGVYDVEDEVNRDRKAVPGSHLWVLCTEGSSAGTKVRVDAEGNTGNPCLCTEEKDGPEKKGIKDSPYCREFKDAAEKEAWGVAVRDEVASAPLDESLRLEAEASVLLEKARDADVDEEDLLRQLIDFFTDRISGDAAATREETKAATAKARALLARASDLRAASAAASARTRARLLPKPKKISKLQAIANKLKEVGHMAVYEHEFIKLLPFHDYEICNSTQVFGGCWKRSSKNRYTDIVRVFPDGDIKKMFTHFGFYQMGNVWVKASNNSIPYVLKF